MSRKRKQKCSPEPVIATIQSLSHEGRGIAIIEGKTTFIRGALPGETVSFIYTRKRGRFDEGVLETVIEASPNRVTPPCEFYGTCGGCNFQHLAPEQQLLHKQTVFLEQLQSIANTQPDTVLPPLTGDSIHYRRKARLGVRYVAKKERVLVGFREINGRFLADMQACKILHPSVGQHLADFSTLIASLTQYRQIAQIEIAVGDEVTALMFRHLEPLPDEDIDRLIAFGKAHHYAIYLQPKGPDSIHKIFPDTQPLLHYTLAQYDITLQFHPIDFVQVNREINEQMLTQALDLLQLQATDTVMDLFCGLGNFSLPMARFAKTVIGIEGDQAMVTRATKNAALNGIDNVRFHAADLFNAAEPLLKQPADKILLDPPRAGAQEIMPALAQTQATRIVYVSCNPATLARDSKILLDHGYRLETAGVMDMFPHTSHVEAMALFVKIG